MSGPLARGPTDGARASGSHAMAGFLAVGVSGLFVNTAALTAAVGLLHVHYAVGLIAATLCSTTWNFLLVERWVYRARRAGRRSMARRYLQFFAMNSVALALRGPLVVALTEIGGIHYALSNLISLVVAFVGRYVVADRVIWRRQPTPEIRIEVAHG